MKDYSFNIIDYRGGKAVLIDVLNIIQFMSLNPPESRELKTRLKKLESQVDYFLLITSYPPELIRPIFREYFNRGTLVNCYRYITPRGKITIRNITDKKINELRSQLTPFQEYYTILGIDKTKFKIVMDSNYDLRVRPRTREALIWDDVQYWLWSKPKKIKEFDGWREFLEREFQ